MTKHIGLVDTRWFQDALAHKRLSQRRLAQLMRLDPAAVSLMLRGKRKMSAAEVAEMARLLDVSAQEVLVRLGAEGHGADLKRSEAVLTTQMGLGKAEAEKTAVKPDFEAEFMRKWMDLGFMLMRGR